MAIVKVREGVGFGYGIDSNYLYVNYGKPVCGVVIKNIQFAEPES